MKINYKVKKNKPGNFDIGDYIRVIKTTEVRKNLLSGGIPKTYVEDIFNTTDSIIARDGEDEDAIGIYFKTREGV